MKNITIIALAFIICSMTSIASNASMIHHSVWVPWRKDFGSYGVQRDVQSCYKALYCPRGMHLINMEHHVSTEPSRIGENWCEHFTSCSADCA